MGARGRVNTGMRRPARDTGFSGRGGGGGGGPSTPPLPSTAIAAWHSEIACTPAAWTDYIGGKSLAGVASPSVGVDAGFFNGHTVAQTFQSGQKYWGDTAMAPWLSAGSRPWVFAVSRYRAVVPENAALLALGCAPIGTNNTSLLLVGGKTTFFINPGAVAVAGPTANTAVHRTKAWADGALAHIKVDETEFTAGYAGSLPAAATACRIGSLVHVDTLTADANHGYVLVCSAKPSVAEEAALDAWAIAYYGL